MLKKILVSIFILVILLFFKTNAAHAALTVGANSVTSDGALTLQGTSVSVTGDTTFSGNLGLAGTAVDSTKFINLDNSTLTLSSPSAFSYGIYNKLVSASNASSALGLVGAQFDAGANANNSLTQLTGAIMQAYTYITGSGTVSNMLGAQLRAVSQSASPVLSMWGGNMLVQNFGTSATPVSISRGAQIATQQSSATAAMTTAIGADISFSGSGAAGYGTLYGLRIGNWSGTAPATTTYGIYMDTTIDRGSTRYALYSSSTSQSYLQGNLGIGTATPGAKLDVTGHYGSSGAAPTPSVTGSGYSGASVGAGSTDTKGTITATVGAAAGTLVVTFNSAYASTPVCTVTPSTATAQVDVIKMYITKSTSALTLNFVATPTGGSESWDYICVQ